MKTRPIATAMAIGAGLIVLSGYFIPALDFIRIEMIQWAVVAGGTAALVGIGNLFTVHFQKVRRREKDSFYSLTLLVSMLGTLLAGMFSLFFNRSLAWLQPAVNAIIVPVEASLMALLAVTLLYASIRLLRRRPDWMSALFLLSAVTIIGATAILPLFLRDIGDVILSWMSLLLAGGGSRGLLMGVALGALTTGLRIIFGIDRPYGGK
ncbi:MAG: hypothetical protein HFACDABA_02776 [Anaerolineales bacterium]|nr:hypothetical protein [Anaerolineales bacterium]